MQNKSLREELEELRKQLAGGIVELRTQHDKDDPPPKYEPDDPRTEQPRARKAISSQMSDYFLRADDSDPDSIERAAMTHSVS